MESDNKDNKDIADIIQPTEYFYQMQGKPQTETNIYFLFSLHITPMPQMQQQLKRMLIYPKKERM